MDLITTSIVTALVAGLAGGAGEVGKKVIVDAYDALKAALNSKFGPNSDLTEAINNLEEKPESQARQSVVAEEVTSSSAVSDSEINELAQSLLDLLEATPEGKAAKSKYQISVQDSQIGVIGDDTKVAGGINFNRPD